MQYNVRMGKEIVEAIRKIVENSIADSGISRQFSIRLSKGKITREENPHTHFCVYFAVYDPKTRRVFIGHHRKSGLVIFTGGHIEKDELPHDAVMREIQEEFGITIPKVHILGPSLLTITDIENPQKVICTRHFDLWYFVRVNRTVFRPLQEKLHKEFSSFGWKTTKQARRLITDRNNREALRYISRSLYSPFP